MKEIILLKNGEIALKGLNRGSFESILLKNIKRRLKSIGDFDYKKAQSAMYIEPKSENIDMDEAVEKISKIFGLAGICRAASCEKNLDIIKTTASKFLFDDLSNSKTFKVETKRSDKRFEYKSPEICREVGGYILEQFPNLTVDVHNPDIVVNIEIRDFGAYIHKGNQPGAGGMPVGSSGKSALMISGGIDSPVAGYMMARRGLELVGIHFESPPYTSERAKLKVIDLCKKVSEYSGRIKLYIVPFTEIQELIRDKCKEEYFTIIMRRVMCKIAEQIALQNDCQALITGESLAQVASQTLSALACTDISCNMPIFRPLIGMDKYEIVEISRKIDTFDISILPYEDCCTVFTPKHPRTNPKIQDILAEESKLDIQNLTSELMDNLEIHWVEN